MFTSLSKEIKKKQLIIHINAIIAIVDLVTLGADTILLFLYPDIFILRITIVIAWFLVAGQVVVSSILKRQKN